uniref:Uncharacterized protein n=1 Tax=Rhizophora mucronata TaxID=61149 RepID=A0A2P2QQ58_RHIMU
MQSVQMFQKFRPCKHLSLTKFLITFIGGTFPL